MGAGRAGARLLRGHLYHLTPGPGPQHYNSTPHSKATPQLTVIQILLHFNRCCRFIAEQ